MDKPDTMSIKEHIFRKLSQELNLPLATIKKVLDNQFRTALIALKTNDSLEIAGLGKFLLNRRMLNYHIKKTETSIKTCAETLKDPLLDDVTREAVTKQFLEMPDDLELLKQRAINYDNKYGKDRKNINFYK